MVVGEKLLLTVIAYYLRSQRLMYFNLNIES